jgi:hypothetical protein
MDVSDEIGGGGGGLRSGRDWEGATAQTRLLRITEKIIISLVLKEITFMRVK